MVSTETNVTKRSTENTNDVQVKKDVVDTNKDVDAKQKKKDKRTYLYKYLLHHDATIRKLATKEDGFHIHKTLGILSLCNFIYRYGYVYNKYGNLGYSNWNGNDKQYRLNWLTMCIHTVLALSSILFRVPKKRISHKPMIIYEEYRQHSWVFTLRCFLVFAASTLFQQYQVWAAPLCVLAMHLLADEITRRHGTKGNTAVRATEKLAMKSNSYRYIGKLYSFYQFLAIGSHVLPNGYLADLGFNAIIAIQSSAFMMTLYRKRIIRGRAHTVIYSLCLVLSAFHICRLVGLPIVLLTLATFILRIKVFNSKYYAWSLFLITYHVVHNYSYINTMFQES